MEITNILIVSPEYKEIKKLIDEKDVQKDIRYVLELNEEDMQWADALVGFHINGDADYSKVKWVHSLGAGVDQFLFKREWNENVLLTRTICSFGPRIAEYCLSYLLKDLQLHKQFQENKERRYWQPMTPKLLSEQKVMIYGTGEIGQTVAKTLSFFGAQVFGVSLSGKTKEGFNEVMTVKSHYSYLSGMDTIINTLPLTEETELLFNADIFQELSGAAFMNVGRGASLDESALLDALKMGKVSYAVLDVFAEEPLKEEHLFWNHPHIYITPHISAVTTPEEGVECFLETLKNIEGNKPLRNKVDVKRKY